MDEKKSFNFDLFLSDNALKYTFSLVSSSRNLRL